MTVERLSLEEFEERHEVREVLRKASGGAAARAPEFSDEALALAFADERVGMFLYCDEFARWYLWDNRWCNDKKRSVFTLARKLCRDAAGRALRQIPDKPHARREAKCLASNTTVASVISLARADERLAVASDEFDRDPMLANTPDGTIDLKTGELFEHRQSDLITKIMAAGFSPGDECPQWQKFLAKVTAGNLDLQKYLQRVAGYCLTGLTTEHALFFLWGTGANGKSTFVNTLTAIWGDYAAVADMEMLTESPLDRHPTELARLHGARLVTAQETSQGRRWAEGRIKALTGGDPITARFMRRDFFTFTPQFKLLIAGNHKPSLRGIDEAIRRRLHMIPFTVRIPPNERDPHLFDKLREEWPAIIGWAVRGCIAWRAEGLNPPPAVLAATDDYFENEDMLGQWLEEFVMRSTFGFEPNSELYASWKRWAERAGYPAGSQTAFVGLLADRGYVQHRTNKARGFKEICLKRPDYTDDPRYGE